MYMAILIKLIKCYFEMLFWTLFSRAVKGRGCWSQSQLAYGQSQSTPHGWVAILLQSPKWAFNALFKDTLAVLWRCPGNSSATSTPSTFCLQPGLEPITLQFPASEWGNYCVKSKVVTKGYKESSTTQVVLKISNQGWQICYISGVSRFEDIFPV